MDGNKTSHTAGQERVDRLCDNGRFGYSMESKVEYT